MSIEWQIKSPYSLLPSEGQNYADYLRDEFISKALDICGDVRLFYLPRSSEGATSTDRSRHAATLTYDASVSGQYSTLGSGVSVSFDGSTDYGTVPDNDRYSFGDGTNDQPFSIVAWINPTSLSSSLTIASRLDKTTGTTRREWEFSISSTGVKRTTFEVWDDSAAAVIGRQDASTGISTATWAMVAGTYDGSRAVPGIKVYKNAVQVDDTNSSSGTYVAMENTAESVRLAHQIAAGGSVAQLFNGYIACVILTAEALTIGELWALKSLGNAFFDLSL